MLMKFDGSSIEISRPEASSAPLVSDDAPQHVKDAQAEYRERRINHQFREITGAIDLPQMIYV